MREGAQIALHKFCDVALTVDKHSRRLAIAVVLDVSAKHFYGTFQGLTALPLAHGDGISGLAHGSRAPIAADEERILVDPGHILLAAWQDETALDKLAGLDVDLAQRVGVFTSGGERHEAILIV